MAKPNAANERVKREYFAFLREAKGRDEASIDRVASSLARFENSTNRKDFKRFHREQAVAFKRRLADALNSKTGEKLSKATLAAILRDLKAFFEWLSREPGYRSKVHFSDADYFNQSEKDAAVARAKREKKIPTVAQVERVLEAMPTDTVLQRRDRALIAFTALTAARVGALASFQIGHVNVEELFVDHDARQVRTKFAKSFRTFFMPVCSGAVEIIVAWIKELRDDHLWNEVDPLFPSTQMGLSALGGFEAQGISRKPWGTTEPIRGIFRRAFEIAELPYFNTHSFRDMLVHHAMSLNLSPERMKAWSQNLGHEEVLTTLTSYGKVPVHKQGDLIRSVGSSGVGAEIEKARTSDLIAELARRHS